MHLPETIEVEVDFRPGELYWGMLAMAVYVFRYLLLGIAVLSCVSLGGLLYGLLDAPMNGMADDVGLLLFPFVEGAVPAVVVLIPLIMFVRTRQVLRSEALSPVRHYIFSERGIDIKSQHINAQVQWTAVRRVRETKRFLFIFLAPQMANILPKRCVSSETALVSLRTMFRANVKKIRLLD